MIRRLAKRALKRLVSDAPHIPSAPPTGRARPTRGQADAPPEAESASSPEHDEDEGDGSEVELSAESLRRWVDEGRELLVIDIREPHELWSGAPEGGLLMPMNGVPARLAELPRDRALVVVCAAGMRSFGVAHYLREQGLQDSWSLSEGFGGMVSAGLPYHQPPTVARHRLTSRVQLLAPQDHDLPDGVREGTVQRAREVDGAVVYDVQLPLPEGGYRVVEGLAEGALTKA